jgi:predicted nucleic acid-binding Zn ribbon protein
MTESKLRKCPRCGKFKLHRLIGAGGGIIFRGSGFYETDYKRKEPAEKKEPAAASAKTGKDESGSCCAECKCTS